MADSYKKQNDVIALKEYPLTVEEVNRYGGVGTANNHVNKYTEFSTGTAVNWNGYGGMVYYSSETCGYVNGSLIIDGCTSSYESSDVKVVIDSWASDKFKNDELIDSHLLTSNEWLSIRNYRWRYIEYVDSWTMLQYNANHVYVVTGIGNIDWSYGPITGIDSVRPVINVYKSAIE